MLCKYCIFSMLNYFCFSFLCAYDGKVCFDFQFYSCWTLTHFSTWIIFNRRNIRKNWEGKIERKNVIKFKLPTLPLSIEGWRLDLNCFHFILSTLRCDAMVVYKFIHTWPIFQSILISFRWRNKIWRKILHVGKLFFILSYQF